MANVFLNAEPRDIETAIMLEQSIIHDIGKAVAYTNGKRIYLNTEDNLYKILPSYNNGMLKWLLWHERLHMELNHHKRYFDYLEELKRKDKEFNISHQEVNIIMDILVHDQLSKWLPDLVETAKENLAQFRNRNSLKYTFTTFTLEEMLEEYRRHKEDDSKDKDKGENTEDSKGEPSKDEDKDKEDKASKPSKPSDKEDSDKKDEKEHTSGTSDKPRKEDGEPDESEKDRPSDEHDTADWEKLDDIDTKEFLSDDETWKLDSQIEELKRKKIKLGKLTETLNGLATTTRSRTYAKPNPIKLGSKVILKGSTPGRAQLYLCFDASGSMSGELSLFKEIITKSIPQAMECPCNWFSGRGAKIPPYKRAGGDGYYKGKFKDIMPVYAHNGFSDDGDRTIELCWEAEQQGYSPIGITDGGGSISWSKDKLKQLKRTVLVGQNSRWLTKAKEINPNIQIISL